MSTVHVFTSSAFNYIPKVRMLFQSIRQHHPEWRLYLVLADEVNQDLDISQEPFDEIISITELGIPDWEGWAFCHNIVELATAIKPFMLARLLKKTGCEKVLYFDPDMVLFSRLDDILDALNYSNILLTPHQTAPDTTLDKIMDNEICSLKHGIYNLGFIGVSANEVGHAFADWWSKRLYYFCRADIANGLFTDQRWIDLVPAFFTGVAIMRSPRHNVASWNLSTREMCLTDDDLYLVNDEPLGFYHFTGFDSGAHAVMARKNAGTNKSVHGLIDWYDKETKALANDPLAKVPWAFATFNDGTVIDKCQRLLYRERRDLQAEFPQPFDASGYLNWWNDRAESEYPRLFSDKESSSAMLDISSTLTPGFQAGKQKTTDWGKFNEIVGKVVSNPTYSLEIVARGWEILKTEGIRGVHKRIKK